MLWHNTWYRILQIDEWSSYSDLTYLYSIHKPAYKNELYSSKLSKVMNTTVCYNKRYIDYIHTYRQTDGRTKRQTEKHTNIQRWPKTLPSCLACDNKQPMDSDARLTFGKHVRAECPGELFGENFPEWGECLAEVRYIVQGPSHEIFRGVMSRKVMSGSHALRG